MSCVYLFLELDLMGSQIIFYHPCNYPSRWRYIHGI